MLIRAIHEEPARVLRHRLQQTRSAAGLFYLPPSAVTINVQSVKSGASQATLLSSAANLRLASSTASAISRAALLDSLR